MSITEVVLTIIFLIFIPTYLIFDWKQRKTEKEAIKAIKKRKPKDMYFGQDKH